jgi:hypothetical protein
MGVTGSTGLKLGGGSAGVLISGSAGITLLGGGISGFGFGGVSEGGLVMASGTDAATFISRFSDTTTLISAINSNKASITSQEATVFQRSLTGSVAAQLPYLLVGADSLRVGDVANFENTVGLNKADVFVNGQMMMSGTVSDYNASLSDYRVTAQNTLIFNFELKSGDVVKLIERS